MAEGLAPDPVHRDPVHRGRVTITPMREPDATFQRLAQKASGHDDHELMVVRAGDIRALLARIESLRPSLKWVVSQEGSDVDPRFNQIVLGPGYEFTPA